MQLCDVLLSSKSRSILDLSGTTVRYLMLAASLCMLLRDTDVEGSTIAAVEDDSPTGTPEPREFIDACDRPYIPYCDATYWAPDSENCQDFWICDSGFWVKLQCQEGTFFDTITYTCLAEGYVCQEPCPPYTGPPPVDPTAEPGGTCPWIDESNCVMFTNYPDSVVCDIYYLCDNQQELQLRQCSVGTLFDISIRDCISPFPGFSCDPRCPITTVAPTTEQTEVTYTTTEVTEPTFTLPEVSSVTGDDITSSATPEPQTTVTAVEDDSPTGTPEPREFIDACDRPYIPYCDTTYWAPDSENCQDFWICDSGFWVKLRCQEGTFFDTITYTCLAEGYVCQEPCPPYTGPPPVDPTAEPGGTCPWIDESNCVMFTNYPDSVVCDIYYLCDNHQELQLRECLAGTLFDIAIRDCISPFPGFSCDPRCPITTIAPMTDPAEPTVDLGTAEPTVSTGDDSSLVLIILLITAASLTGVVVISGVVLALYSNGIIGQTKPKPSKPGKIVLGHAAKLRPPPKVVHIPDLPT